MEITLDGKKQFLLQSDPGTIGAALIEINEYLQANGRALQNIIADGRDVPAEEITSAFGQMPVSDVQRLEIVSADLRALVKESIAELAEVVPELPVACQELAQVLAGDAPEQAFAGFNQLLEIWSVLKERQTQVANSLGIELTVLELEGSSLSKHEEELSGVLDTARQAMESSDFAKLADLLAYDLSTLAERETSIVQLLHSKV
ncbi:MAG: hypothetical protein IIB38_06690 [Candidatus Hydrogenedentes bacterium]|nr:hypothetical protein [Candidatus Hydrogenedentota bacterium]